ncbi:hypothetical protein HRbin01_01353 [archaeon HR01]|nr:hypothetical protein HRbin01_01353 [archaeon HR01]
MHEKLNNNFTRIKAISLKGKLLPVAALAAIFLSASLPYAFSQEEVAIYNLISRANDPTTQWAIGTVVPPYEFTEIDFGTDYGGDGVARYLTSATLNDGNTYGWVLETRPKAVADGFIQGRYLTPVYVPESGAKLRVAVGFLQGATNGDVEIQINLIVPGSSPPQIIPLLDEEIRYADGVRQFTVDFPASTRGNYYEIALIVLSGDTPIDDDVAWAMIWVTARVGAVSTTTTTATATVTSGVVSTTTTTATVTSVNTVTVTSAATVTFTSATTISRTETTETTVVTTVTQERTVSRTSVREETETVTQTTTVTTATPTTVTQTVQAGLGLRCLIATAAFGSELAAPVQTLREYRDGFVLQTFAGKTFMDVFNAFYYSWSPAVAEAEYSNPVLREAVKYSIYPLIGILQISKILTEPLKPLNAELAVVTAGLVVSTLLGITYLAPLALLFRKTLLARVRTPIRFRTYALATISIPPILALALLTGSQPAVAVASSALVLASLGLGCALPFAAANTYRRARTN